LYCPQWSSHSVSDLLMVSTAVHEDLVLVNLLLIILFAPMLSAKLIQEHTSLIFGTFSGSDKFSPLVCRYGFELQRKAILISDIRVRGTGVTNVLRYNVL
jgi:hypothetical protein